MEFFIVAMLLMFGLGILAGALVEIVSWFKGIGSLRVTRKRG